MSDSSECELHASSSSNSELIDQLVDPSAEQDELEDILTAAETCTVNENLRIQNSRQTKALKQVEVVKMNFKNSGNKRAHPRKSTNKNNRTKNHRIEHVVQRLNFWTADFDGHISSCFQPVPTTKCGPPVHEHLGNFPRTF
ncbi:hypothetical protein OUZ56_011291 [Daphnia magna]|uniref:Uncharacterized protein n=1 Tax=Daphnia magna TaxID=35525 RepID=A0ABQ9YZQ8_9CRUS|nr:hypothetical protein OUZ56_011291 [Daphnia magna]